MFESKIFASMEEKAIDGFLVTDNWNRQYLSGFTGSNGVLIFTKNVKILITDYRYFEQANQQTDFDVVLHADHTGHKWKIFSKVAEQISKLGIQRLGFEQQSINYGDYKTIHELIQTELVPTYDFVEDLRMIKTESEINLLKTASQITDEAYLNALNSIRPGIKETDIASDIISFVRAQGCATSPSITVVSGFRSSMPHGRASNKKIEKGDMITIDFGANYKGYWSDMARTVSVGEPDNQMKEIQQIVLESFNNCVKKMKPGLTDKEVDWLMKETIFKKGYQDSAGTGTGHGIGLEVHEKPLFSKFEEKKLQKNMVVSIEPGIYLPNIGGARVEDVLLLTEEGCETLTPSTKELTIV